MKTTLKNILLFFALTFAFQGTLLAQDAPLTAEEYYKLGKEQYYDGDYFKAVESFNKVLDLRLKIYDSNSETLIKPYIRLAKAHEKLRDNLQAIGYLKEALRIVEHNNLPPDQYSPNIFLEMGNTYDNLRRLKEALHYCTKALEIYKKEYGPESPEVGTTYMNMGTVSLSQGYYRNAEQYLHQAFDIIKKSAEPNSVDFNRIYLNLSALYQKTGDFEKAITYGEKALAIKLLNYDRTHPSVPKYFTNLGYSYLDNGDFEKGVGYMEESLQLTKTIFGENHQNTGAAYGSLASYYRGVQNYPKALYFQKKSVAIKEKTLAPDHHYFLGDLLNLGHTYAIGEKFDEALKYYFIVLDGYLNNKNNKSKWIPSLYYDIAMIYLEKEEIEKALSHIREGLQYLDQTFTFEANDFYKNPAIEEVQNHRTFLKLLRKKSLLLQIRYSKTKKLQDLKAALKTSELAIELMQKMRRNHLSVSDKISLSARRGSVYRQGVEQAFELYQQTNSQQYLRQAFNISEKSKAGALLESINDQQALENENISVEDQVKITTITRKITNLKEMLFLEKDPALISKIKNELFDLNVDYEAFISSLEKNNNDYYQLKYAPLDISSDEIPQYLPNKNTALIQYFYSKKKVFIFVFIGEELFGFQQAIDADFEQKIHSLRNNQLLNASYNKDDLKNYIQTLNFFHELLIQPVLSNIKTCKNLIIIPHGILQYLSFEALCPSSATADFRTLDYLIKDHHIQYAWSVSLWAKQVKKQHTSTAYEFIGFAPGFKSTKALASITKDLFLTRGPQEIRYRLYERWFFKWLRNL